MTRGGRLVSERMATWMDRAECSYSAATADPSTTLPRISCGDPWLWGSACGSLYREPHTWTSLAARSRKSGYAPVGMTRGGRLVSGRMATWMDRAECRYSAATADPSTTLRSGRNDKGRTVSFRKDGDLDGQSRVQILRGNCRSLHYASLRSE